MQNYQKHFQCLIGACSTIYQYHKVPISTKSLYFTYGIGFFVSDVTLIISDDK